MTKSSSWFAREGNVIKLPRRTSLFETYSYSELLSERRFCRSEIKRMKTARDFAERIDVRGMYQEPFEILDLYDRMIGDLKWAIEELEKEMIKR